MEPLSGWENPRDIHLLQATKSREISDLPRLGGVVSACLSIQVFRVKLERTAIAVEKIGIWKIFVEKDL